jgi:hypothetical protein
MSDAVPPSYRHYPKLVCACAPFAARGAALKWYDIARSETPVPSDIEVDARRFLELALDGGKLVREGDAGFVILHRCAEDFYFLLLQVWRDANECWEAVFAKSGAGPFAAFDTAYPDAGALRPTFCVWELSVVAHEAYAWSRFLRSSRSRQAHEVWLADCLVATV